MLVSVLQVSSLTEMVFKNKMPSGRHFMLEQRMFLRLNFNSHPFFKDIQERFFLLHYSSFNSFINFLKWKALKQVLLA